MLLTWHPGQLGVSAIGKREVVAQETPSGEKQAGRCCFLVSVMTKVVLYVVSGRAGNFTANY